MVESFGPIYVGKVSRITNRSERDLKYVIAIKRAVVGEFSYDFCKDLSILAEKYLDQLEHNKITSKLSCQSLSYSPPFDVLTIRTELYDPTTISNFRVRPLESDEQNKLEREICLRIELLRQVV